MKQKNPGITTHGMSYSKEYTIWAGMKRRCNCKTAKDYNDYGGRGITLCKEWEDFNTFYKDMGNCPSGCSLDRIDNNGGYNKDNCQWADSHTQQRNRKDSFLITFNGKTMIPADWEKIVGIKSDTIRCRIKKGWSPERALTT